MAAGIKRPTVNNERTRARTRSSPHSDEGKTTVALSVTSSYCSGLNCACATVQWPLRHSGTRDVWSASRYVMGATETAGAGGERLVRPPMVTPPPPDSDDPSPARPAYSAGSATCTASCEDAACAARR